jgi:glycerol kinase
VPAAVLPEVRPTSGVFGETAAELFGRPIPITALGGDQQAATFGQACFAPGQAKNTYGTGAFLLLNTGVAPRASEHGLLTTVGWQLGGRSAGPAAPATPATPATYALEGSVFSAGSAGRSFTQLVGYSDKPTGRGAPAEASLAMPSERPAGSAGRPFSLTRR